LFCSSESFRLTDTARRLLFNCAAARDCGQGLRHNKQQGNLNNRMMAMARIAVWHDQSRAAGLQRSGVLTWEVALCGSGDLFEKVSEQFGVGIDKYQLQSHSTGKIRETTGSVVHFIISTSDTDN
jgi:hypothetical protein